MRAPGLFNDAVVKCQDFGQAEVPCHRRRSYNSRFFVTSRVMMPSSKVSIMSVNEFPHGGPGQRFLRDVETVRDFGETTCLLFGKTDGNIHVNRSW